MVFLGDGWVCVIFLMLVLWMGYGKALGVWIGRDFFYAWNV